MDQKTNFLAAIVVVAASLTFLASAAGGERRIKVLGWNVEARNNNPSTIEKHLCDLDGFDILGLCEVHKDNFDRYRKAASRGEGVDNHAASFRYIPGTTGHANLRLAIIYDARRFEEEANFELEDIEEGHRAPLVARFKIKNSDPPVRFLFMVNHLARTSSEKRRKQAKKLQLWAKENDSLPIIAVGDYNYDFSVDELSGNPAFDLMLKDDVFSWVRPAELYKTQLNPKYNGVLDFVFTAHLPDDWRASSRILTHGFPVEDTDQTSDHRPVQARFFIPSE